MAGFEIDAAHLIGIFLGLLIYGKSNASHKIGHRC